MTFPGAALADWRARTTPSDPAERAVHQAVLRAFAATGRPPARDELAPIAEAHGAGIEEVLSQLHQADVVRLGPAGEVAVAYPFSSAPTRHRVRILGGADVFAMCAIDALGVAEMLGVDVEITSNDPYTGHAVTVHQVGGASTWQPSTTVVVVPASTVQGPSADCCCSAINFFASRQTAEAWSTADPELHGEILDQPAAERLGRRIFGSLLRE